MITRHLAPSVHKPVLLIEGDNVTCGSDTNTPGMQADIRLIFTDHARKSTASDASFRPWTAKTHIHTFNFVPRHVTETKKTSQLYFQPLQHHRRVAALCVIHNVQKYCITSLHRDSNQPLYRTWQGTQELKSCWFLLQGARVHLRFPLPDLGKWWFCNTKDPPCKSPIPLHIDWWFRNDLKLKWRWKSG